MIESIVINASDLLDYAKRPEPLFKLLERGAKRLFIQGRQEVLDLDPALNPDTRALLRMVEARGITVHWLYPPPSDFSRPPMRKPDEH